MKRGRRLRGCLIARWAVPLGLEEIKTGRSRSEVNSISDAAPNTSKALRRPRVSPKTRTEKTMSCSKLDVSLRRNEETERKAYLVVRSVYYSSGSATTWELGRKSRFKTSNG